MTENRKTAAKSTVEEIKERFDKSVEKYSNLETGQITAIDARLSLELMTEAAHRIVPNAENLLDVGCGGGNYTLTMLTKIPGLNCTLVDLSRPMLDKARERISAENHGELVLIQGDIREVDLPEEHFDIILAGAVLHHLREDHDWEDVFAKLYRLLRPGGCLMISDLVIQETDAMTEYTWLRYGDYLEGVGGKSFRKEVMAYVEKEDSPRSVTYQLDLMKRTGFSKVEVLHKNMCFGTFGGIK